MQKKLIAGTLAAGLLTLAAAPQGNAQVVRTSAEQRDTLLEDTLRAVIVTPDGRIPLPQVKMDLGPRQMSVSDVLGKKLTDKIMHPFAFSERKREKHRRKMLKILEEYEKIKTPREEILEALRQEGINIDSLLQANQKQ